MRECLARSGIAIPGCKGNFAVRCAAVALWMFSASFVNAQQAINIALLTDGQPNRLVEYQDAYVNELLTLTAGEFAVTITEFEAAWTRASIEAQIDAAYADPSIDMLLVTGFVANQVAATRRDFLKPTFLPILLDTGLLPVTVENGSTGIRNLSYLGAYADFSADLETLSRITPYDNLVLFLDEHLASAIPELREQASNASTAHGVSLQLVTYDGVDHDLVSRIPDGTDAIFVAGLPRMPPADFNRLIEAINAAGLPSYSFAGVADVERGLLATNTEPRDIDRQARLNALNMQAVMLGGRAEDQPTTSSQKEQLTINMATARQIGISPSFDVLDEAVLLNRDAQVTGEAIGLVDIARRALDSNQDLRAEGFNLQAGSAEISRARAALLPQVGLSAGQTIRKDTLAVQSGAFAERSVDGSLTLDQLIYSDSASANLSIQKSLQFAREASLQQFRLDIVQAATTAYYSVLNARSQLRVQENNQRITRTNLELAEDRVRLGNSTRADVYRWQAELARAQIGVLDARSQLNQAWETLNRLLHQPQGARLPLREASFNEPFIMRREEFDALISSPADYARFSAFYIRRALSQAPELDSLAAQIAAKRREVKNTQRAFWLPDFSVGSRATRNFGQSGLGAGPAAGEDLNDWSIGIQATLPLFSGGLKRANLSRARFELARLEALQTATSERVEEAIRNQLHAAEAAYAQIDLAETAAEASRRNFDLVSDAYASGTVSVIDLLDAQDSSLEASAAAAESVYRFLITIMSLQRAVGGYDFLLSAEDRQALALEFRNEMAR